MLYPPCVLTCSPSLCVINYVKGFIFLPPKPSIFSNCTLEIFLHFANFTKPFVILTSLKPHLRDCIPEQFHHDISIFHSISLWLSFTFCVLKVCNFCSFELVSDRKFSCTQSNDTFWTLIVFRQPSCSCWFFLILLNLKYIRVDLHTIVLYWF